MMTRYFVPRCFDVWTLKRSSVKLTKLLVRCLNAPWKSFYVTYRSSDLRFLLFVTFWKLIRSRAVAPCWLDDTKECIQSAWSKQHDYCSLAHGCWSLRKLYFSNISRKLFVVFTWILNGSSIECQEKKHRPLLKYAILSGKSFVTRTWKLKLCLKHNFKFFGKLEK